MKGCFYGVGVGPGDPDLITLKGYKVLEKVDVICAPQASEEKESLAFSVVRKALKKDLRVLKLVFPMTRDKSKLEAFWDDASRKVAELLRDGKDVAFVTIGDPSLYSTYSYLLAKLKDELSDLRVKTIPGVTSMLACAAAANSSIAEGEETLAIFPAIGNVDDLRDVLIRYDNVVIMKAARKLDQIIALLSELGLKDKAFFANRCGLSDQFLTFDLDKVSSFEQDYFSLLVVRKNFSRKNKEEGK